MRKIGQLLTAGCVASVLACTAARPDTFADALVTAYQTSPLLEANRAALRSLDEEVPLALSAKRPQIGAEAQATTSTITGDLDTFVDDYQAQLGASLLLFDNGQTEAAVDSARMTVAAGRADLTVVEQQVLFAAAEAYLNLLRDREVVEIARNNVGVLEEQVRAAETRFEVGEVTRTDVSLAEAAFAASRSRLAEDVGQLELAQQNYINAVGMPPDELEPVPPIPDLPASIEQAMAIAYRQNPTIISEQFGERAAAYDLERARAAKGPSVSAIGEVGLLTDRRPNFQEDVRGTIGLTGEVPLYTGGRNNALIRQALAVLEQSKAEVQSAGREVALDVEGAWIQLDVARASILASRQEIEAARIAFEGISEEARLGARSTLDVLQAEQDRLEAQASLIAAVRNEQAAAYSLLQAMGLMTVGHLGLGVEAYDPEVNYRQVQRGRSGGVDTSVVDRIRSRWE